MQSDKPHVDGGAARPETESAGHVSAPPTQVLQLDSPALTSTTTSVQHGDHSRTAAPYQGDFDLLEPPGEATEGAEQGEVGPALEYEEETPGAPARRLAAPATVGPEQGSMALTALEDVTPDAQPVAVPFQSVFTIPRPPSLTSRITEPTTNVAAAMDDSAADEGDAQMHAHIERQLGVSTTNEQGHHTQVLEQPPSGDSLLVLASATRSVSVPTSEDVQHPQEGGAEPQRQQHQPRKRPRSAGSGGDDDAGRETDQGSRVAATFEAFSPGWHLEGASSNVQGGGEAGASPSSVPDAGDEDLEPASPRHRTEEPAPGPPEGEAPTTMQQFDQAHQKWRQHREATLRSLQAQTMARSAAARHPAAPSSAGPSLPPSYETYSSIASDGPGYPYDGTLPLLPPQAMMGGGGGGGASTFSGRAGTTATTSTQWYAKGSVAEAYYIAHEQQRGQSGIQGHPAPHAVAAADSAWQTGGVAPRQARSIYDSPRPPQPYTSSSSSYYYGGVPGYVYQSTPQQQRHQRYPSPLPGPPLPQPGEYDVSSPSTSAAASSTLSNLSGNKAEWSDRSSSANTTASTSINNTSASSSLLSRETEVAETRNAIPIRTQSNLASIMHSAPAPDRSYSQGSQAPTPESSSVLVGTEQGQGESQDPTSPVASGSGAGATALPTTSASKGRKTSGRRLAPANAYSIEQVPGVKPFIYKLRWLLQNPQEVGNVITWSNDGSAVLVKIGGGNDAMLKQMLLRTFAHENPGAFTRQFAVYGFTPIKDPEELAEVLDPATQPADAWRAYENKSGTFHRDGLDDLDALKTMVAKKKGGGGSAATTTNGPGRTMPAVQQRPQPQPSVGIPVQGIGEGTVLPSIPGGAIAATAGTGFPTLQQGYWPPAATRSGDPHASSSSSTTQHYQQQQQHASPSPSASASGLASAVAGKYIHSAPKPVGAAQAQGEVGSSRSKNEGSLGDWFRQAADVPRVGGIESLLRGTEAVSTASAATATAAAAGDDHQDGGAFGDVSELAEEEEEEEGGGVAEV